MKQLLQNLKNGELSLAEAPMPVNNNQCVLVQSHYSAVSPGTEKAKIELGKKSLLQKARARPDQVKKVFEKVKTQGLWRTYQLVNERLETLSPLGYSCAGTVWEVGTQVRCIQPGDRVACAGAGYANHAEIVTVPQNLIAKIPDSVPTDQAAFTTIGAIALQGVRVAQPQLGEQFLVIGLGVIGQLTVQLLLANGCTVLAMDPDSKKVGIAQDQGAIGVQDAETCLRQCRALSHGRGIDGVIICASTDSNQPVTLAGEATREKGRVVAVGAVGLNLPRNPYYQKEIEFTVARSYGPGRYDPSYEEKGQDYPYGYVRFTENRNMVAFLQLLSQSKLDLKPLITHRFPFYDALQAYDMLTDSDRHCLGVVFQYNTAAQPKPYSRYLEFKPCAHKINVSMVGAGQYATGTLLPLLKRCKTISLQGVMTAKGYTATQIAHRFGFHAVTDDLSHLLKPPTDLMMITTQHHQHAELVIQGLKAGRHVYVEKPLALSEHDLNEIHKTHLKYPNSLLWVGFNRRFAPLTQQLQTFLQPLNEPKVIDIDVNAGPIDTDHWIQDPERGGGRIIGEACHFIDLASALADSLPISVYCRGLPSPHQSASLNDNVLINLAFENGSIANITYTANGANAMPKEKMTVNCAGRSAVLNDFKQLILYQGHKTLKHVKHRRQDKGQSAMLQALIKSLKQGRAVLSYESIVMTTLTTFRAINSLATGTVQPVHWQWSSKEL